MSNYGSYPNPDLCRKYGKYKLSSYNWLRGLLKINVYYCSVCECKKICNVK